MSEPTTIELQHILAPEVYNRLQAEADRQQTPLGDLVRDAIEDFLDHLNDDLEDTPDEKIEADLRQAWHESLNGQTISAREALASLRKTEAQHDDQG